MKINNNQVSLLNLLFIVLLTGASLGVLAQILRQLPEPFMFLGASTSPWLMSGYFLSFFVSKSIMKNPLKAILIAIVTIYIYLIVWLVFYHFLFVLQENLSFENGWQQAAPWLLLTLFVSPILGIFAALTHKSGVLGDICLSTPIAWSLPEILRNMNKDSLDHIVMMVPVAILITLMIRTVIKERRVQVVTLLVAIIVLGSFAFIIYPVYRNIIPY